MASGFSSQHKTNDPRSRHQRSAREDEVTSRQGLLVGERTYPGLSFIDGDRFHEGAFVGYFLDVPYDWNMLDPDLMKEES